MFDFIDILRTSPHIPEIVFYFYIYGHGDILKIILKIKNVKNWIKIKKKRSVGIFIILCFSLRNLMFSSLCFSHRDLMSSHYNLVAASWCLLHLTHLYKMRRNFEGRGHQWSQVGPTKVMITWSPLLQKSIFSCLGL